MKVNKVKVVITFLVLCVIVLIWYIIVLKKNANNTTIVTKSEVEVESGVLTDSIDLNGTAELANEQKLHFPQSGKVANIYVNVGDYVEEGAVLAALDKREFYQEMAQANNQLEKIERNIVDEKAKANWPEARQMEREIASMKRKLEEMEEDFQKAVQNSPGKNQEKLLDLKAKKRDIEVQKEKYKLDLAAYEREEKNKDELVNTKIEDGRKLVQSTVRDSANEVSEIRQIQQNINKIFGFDMSELSFDERFVADYIGNNSPTSRREVEDDWRETKDLIDSYTRLSFQINTNSDNADDAIGLVNEETRVYKKFQETLIAARRAAEATQTDENGSFTRSELNKVLSDITGLQSTVSSKISTLNTNKENLFIVESPENIKERFLYDLSMKKLALDKANDDIKRAELQLAQDEKGITVIDDTRVQDNALRRELADKQSAIQDQKDSILTKTEDLQKLKSGKSDALENLQTNYKDQLAEIEKLKTKEESYEIRAPFAGTIRSIQLKIGDVIGGSSSSGDNSAEKIILLENNEIINIKVDFNQLDIIKVKVGQQADISFDAIPDAHIEGKISEISSTPSDNNQAGWLSTYPAIISAKRSDFPIYSGMNASINIPLESNTEALLVPVTAVSEDPVSGDKYVNVVEQNGNITKTPIETGKTNKTLIEILSGLSAGQKVQIIDFSANNYKPDEFSSNIMY